MLFIEGTSVNTDERAINFISNPFFDRYMAIKREVAGRSSWQARLLPRPHTSAIAGLESVLAGLRAEDLTYLEHVISESSSGEQLLSRMGGIEYVEKTLAAINEISVEDLGSHPICNAHMDEAFDESARDFVGEPDWAVSQFLDALGFELDDFSLRIYLVPAACFHEPCGLLWHENRDFHGYIDYRRFRGADLIEAALTLVARAMDSLPATDMTPAVRICNAIPVTARERAALASAIPALIAFITSAEIIRNRYNPSHVDMAERLGLYIPLPNICATMRPSWRRYLRSIWTQAAAVEAIIRELSRQRDDLMRPRLVSRMAADFYLLELMAAQGNETARSRLSGYETDLASELVRYLHVVIGAELGHVQDQCLDSEPEVAAFIRDLCKSECALGWRAVFDRLGTRALLLGERAFAMRSGGYGNQNKWSAIARHLRLYLDGEIPCRLFIDQCFSLRHNNGPIFDKLYDSSRLTKLLDAQAAGDVDGLLRHSSVEVRGIWRGHEVLISAGRSTRWLGIQQLAMGEEPGNMLNTSPRANGGESQIDTVTGRRKNVQSGESYRRGAAG